MNCLCFSKRIVIISSLFVVMNMLAASVIAEENRLKPFVLASEQESTDLASLSKTTVTKLKQAGFEIAGEYSPYQGTNIIIVTSPELRQQAAASNFGAFGAIQRVTITNTDKTAQVSFTNPEYMAQTYRMKSDLTAVRSKLASALGSKKEYGSEEGLTKEDLREYQYKWLMPYFTDRHMLVDYGSQAKALETIEKVLATQAGGTSKVYRVDLPGKQETVIGVHLQGPADNDCSGDQYIMSRIDFRKVKSAGHLPYEFVVSNGKVYALYAEFRIAINFPDLSMMGSNSFASIMCAPAAIKTALTKAVGGKENRDDEF